MFSRLTSLVEYSGALNVCALTSLRSICSSAYSSALREPMPPKPVPGTLPGAEKPDLVTQYLSLENTSNDEQVKAALASVTREFQRFPGDTGSTEVQVARLTEKIKQLAEHLKVHRKDYSSMRGLQAMLAQRRALLQYYRRANFDGYAVLISRLGLKDSSYVTQNRFTRRYKPVVKRASEQ